MHAVLEMLRKDFKFKSGTRQTAEALISILGDPDQGEADEVMREICLIWENEETEKTLMAYIDNDGGYEIRKFDFNPNDYDYKDWKQDMKFDGSPVEALEWLND